MSAPTYATLSAYDKRVAGMLADPECVGELLLVGIAMARSVDLHDPDWDETGHMPMKVIAERVYGNRYLPTTLLGIPDRTLSGAVRPRKRVRSLFFADRRRYSPELDGDRNYHDATCGRPMVRRDGLCGRNASSPKRLVDPATGVERWVGSCSQPACKAWFADLLERNCAELAAHPAPVPPANTGGVLERHLPEIDWWKVWAAVDPNWSPPPEGRAFERPTLRLLVSDCADDVPLASNVRPALVLHKGGWR